MTHIFDLDDDALLLVFQVLRDYCPFTSLVCSRFCRLVTRVHFPYHRRANVGILMQRQETLCCYKSDRRVVELLQGPRHPSWDQSWSKLARTAAIQHGTPAMINLVLGAPSCEAALQSGRVDMLDEMVGHKPTTPLCESLKFLAESCGRRRDSYGHELTTHCTRTLLAACNAPSSASFEWIKSRVSAASLSNSSNWAFIWSELSGISKRIVLCAASEATEDTLDCILGLFVEYAPPDKILVFEGMCAVVVTSNTRSVGAWKWLQKHVSSRMETLDSVLKRLVSAVQNKEPTHTVRFTSILDMGFVGVKTFAVRDVQSYHIVKDGLSQDGWLRRAFFDACGCGCNFTSMCLFCNMNVSSLPQHRPHTVPFEELVVDCTKDMAEDYVRVCGTTRCFVVKALQVASELSVEAAYDVSVHLATLALDDESQERRRNELLYERGFLGVVLSNSIKRVRSAIVEDIVAKTRLFCLRSIDINQRLQLASTVSSSSSRTTSMKRIAACVASFCPINRDVLRHCVTRRNHVVFGALTTVASKRVRLETGCDVLKHNSVELLEIAFAADCFARGSEEEMVALHLLTQHELQDSASAKRQRRVLPFRIAEPRVAGKLHSGY